MEAQERQTFAPGDVVLCKVKGIESWPARVVDPEVEQFGPQVEKSRPRSHKHFLMLVRRFANN